jgi:hypothetical protein
MSQDLRVLKRRKGGRCLTQVLPILLYTILDLRIGLALAGREFDGFAGV